MPTTKFLTQPSVRVGDILFEGFREFGPPLEFSFVSAFVSLTTALRLKAIAQAVRDGGGTANLILGVDLGGTSKEVLEEIFSWDVTTTIVKNRLPGVTFHPKLYMCRWRDRAEIIVGSNNMTEGGFFRNYEVATLTSYALPSEVEAYKAALEEISSVITPIGPTARKLTREYLKALLSLAEIPSETEARQKRGDRVTRQLRDEPTAQVFGFEQVPPAPDLPSELQTLLLSIRGSQQRERGGPRQIVQKEEAGQTAFTATLAETDPTHFYMTLPAMQADNPEIPGEPRIPLQALDMARDFWGWPYNYEISVNPRAGDAAKERRVYHNWRARWRIASADSPNDQILENVRMYYYENSSDFRFYAGGLKRLGAASGDMIRLSKSETPDIDFECVLAARNSPAFADWERFLVNTVRSGNSNRSFGYT